MKQLEVLNEYYTDLDYNIDKDEALEKILNLSKTVRFHNSINISDRLEVLANIIQDNISFFKSVCAHVDTIDTIVGYLNHYAAYIKCFEDLDDSFETIEVTIFSLILTLFIICDEFAIKAFLQHPIFTDSLWPENTYSEILTGLGIIDSEIEMIILEDSDLYAVVNYLIRTDKFILHNIWVQEQVKEKFVWLMKRHYSEFTACEEMLLIIDTFQSLEDIQLRVYHEPTISIVSIWSEDIVAAKNLALSLNVHYLNYTT
ncbi:uncharacterized protein [Temnothorax nylanderi]|uniref:uncharacterized protein n=1 Tax=Temnothorax nylanderi TaxID=102681 RepID=UPI003A8C2FF5